MTQGLRVEELFKELNPFRDPHLARAIEGNIELRTGLRIHRLQVEVTDCRVVVHGCAASYHAKQLALTGALEVLGSNNPELVELDIQIVATDSGGNPRRSVDRAGV